MKPIGPETADLAKHDLSPRDYRGSYNLLTDSKLSTIISDVSKSRPLTRESQRSCRRPTGALEKQREEGPRIVRPICPFIFTSIGLGWRAHKRAPKSMKSLMRVTKCVGLKGARIRPALARQRKPYLALRETSSAGLEAGKGFWE